MSNDNDAPTVVHAKLGEPCDEYERELMARCKDDPTNVRLAQLTIKHLKARRQQLRH